MIEVRALRPEDDRGSFHSGDPDLDRFFHRYAGQNQFRHHIGTTYVAVEHGTILGFATVAAAELEAKLLPHKPRAGLPHYPLPALRLARLAVSEDARGRGVGQHLVRAVFALAYETAVRIGCVGVLVDAKANAVGFYERLGFAAIAAVSGELGDRPVPTPMFIAIGSIPKPA